MEMCSVAELSRGARRILASPEPYVVTNNGRAQSLVVNVEGLSLDDCAALSRSVARAYVGRLRQLAAAKGLSGMSDGEIQAEVDAARAAS